MDLLIPLYGAACTLLMALTKVDFSTTEKVMRKMSVLG
jgi:hypothetical protein